MSSFIQDESEKITSETIHKLFCQVGSDTDIGGGRENQDDFFVWQKQECGVSVFGVLDGHGREVGKIAANAAKLSIRQFCDESYQDLLANPSAWLIEAHRRSHVDIKHAFKTELEVQGYEILEDPEGYLLKRKNSLQPWSCVHGGTSCSLVAVIDFVMFVANVGDSTATLCASDNVLTQSMTDFVVDASLPPGSTLSHGEKVDSVLTDTIVITAEHSPESSYEFLRLREFRQRDGDPSEPALMVVYDSPSYEKARCNPVFEFDSSGLPCVTGRGRYYKNVRKEWASLVSTPLTARFQDALAFTRSLGDLHLHTYGVTNLPEIHRIDLAHIFQSLSATHTLGPQLPLLCLVLATDGVWDNWTYEDVTKFVLDPSCVGAVRAGPDGAHRVALSFMQRNGIYAKRNFGAQADNATGIVVYMSISTAFPAGPDTVR